MAQLYSATYSNVNVYEYVVNGGSVMRRKKDDWVNATHILKAANFAKAKRTRILEKEVQTGQHEKIQGGYGKYQGTWIPLEEAKVIAQRFKVDDLLAPILNHIAKNGEDEPPLAPRHHHAKKDSATAATRSSTFPSIKKTKTQNGAPRKRGRPKREVPAEQPITVSSMIEPETFDMLQTFEDKPEPEPVLKKKRGRKPKQKDDVEIIDDTTINQSFTTPIKMNKFANKLIRSFVNEKSSPLNEKELNTYYNGQHLSDLDHHEEDEDNERAAHLRRMLENDPSSSPNEFIADSDLATVLKSPESLNGLGIKNTNNLDSKQYAMPFKDSEEYYNNDSQQGKSSWFYNSDEFTRRIINYFMKPDEEINETTVPAFLRHLPKDFDVNKIIDPDYNTTLHWACAMGNLPIIELLLKLGADNKIRNKYDEIPLTRSVKFNNSYGKRTFSKILDLLRDTIFETDSKNRTLLHHIAMASNGTQKANSSRYYSEMLLAKISDLHSMDRVMKFINLRDKKGNTALFYAVSHQSKKCVKVLLSHGARSDIKNNKGQSADSMLVVTSPSTPNLVSSHQDNVKNINRILNNGHKLDNISENSPSIVVNKSEEPNKEDHEINRSRDLITLLAALEPRYSEPVLAATEKSAFTMIQSLNQLSNLYDDELQKQQTLIQDLNQYHSGILMEISTIEKNVINSSISANQSFENGDSENGTKSGLFHTIIESNQSKLNGRIEKQKSRLHQKTADLQNFLTKVQSYKVKSQEISSKKPSNLKSNPFIESENEVEEISLQESVAMMIQIAKLEVSQKSTTKKILANFEEASETDPKNSRVKLYRRLIAACCNTGIDEVDSLIDVMLESLEGKQQ